MTAESGPSVSTSTTNVSDGTPAVDGKGEPSGNANGSNAGARNVPTGPGLRPTSGSSGSAGASSTTSASPSTSSRADQSEATRPVQSDTASRAFAAGAAARSAAAAKQAEQVADRPTEKPAEKPAPTSADKPAARTVVSPAADPQPTKPSAWSSVSAQATQATQLTPSAPVKPAGAAPEGRISAAATQSSRLVTNARTSTSASGPAAPAPPPFVGADRPATGNPEIGTDRGGWDQGTTPEDRFEQQGYSTSAPVTPTGRVAQLTVSSINLWSVLKVSLMLSIAAGVALVIATSVLWMMLKGIGVFDQLNGVLGDAANQANGFDIYDYVGFGRVLSLSLLVSVVNVFLLMGFSIVTALIYNLAAGLVGGIRVTLSDE